MKDKENKSDYSNKTNNRRNDSFELRNTITDWLDTNSGDAITRTITISILSGVD